MLTKSGDINVKAFGDNVKACSIVSKSGNVDLQFTGNVDINEITAADKINIVAGGKTLKIDNLGKVPSTPTDYYGKNTTIAPQKVVLKALDIANGKTNHAQSEIIVVNARVKGDNNSNTNEITVVADDVYIDGKHYINDDELVEVTPINFRMRKKILNTEQRKKIDAKKNN